ncbi:uncharacterized protein V1513DRAFT_453168, partial [Lipomyces chichibuensis]|uniref:uncharacterized protein n=1 Tax=Lipomyces chichibuensis TaxID=1546026 RepID=UPI00334315E2
PRISRMARDLLAVPGKGFSVSCNLVTVRRTRLGNKTIEACMCLKCWDWSGEPNDGMSDEVEESDAEEASC